MSIDTSIRHELEYGMDATTFKEGERQAAVALSTSGEMYMGAGFASQTHLLNVEAGASALYVASQAQDYDVDRLVLLHEGEYRGINPVLAQVIIDFAGRTGKTIGVELYDAQEEEQLAIVDACLLAPYYSGVPMEAMQPYMQDGQEGSGKRQQPSRLLPTVERLREGATMGMQTAFLTRPGATRYGAAVMNEYGDVFFGGQYSSFDHRTNIHAEMGASMLARLAGSEHISNLGVISTKFKHEPAEMCGCCRQTLQELTANGVDPKIHRFASEDETVETIRLNEYLPAGWSSEV